MIRKYHIENKEETYLRIWQKINFGKEVLPKNFFEESKIKDSENSFKLNVFQFDGNTRLFYLDDILYWVTSEETMYNYLDTGRAVSLSNNRTYDDTDKHKFYIYNDLIITDKQIIDFEDYKDKKSLTLKNLAEIDNQGVYLIFNEDLGKIKHRLEEIEVEEKQIENSTKEEEVKGNEEEEKLLSLIRQYDKMTLLEDKDTIIKDNYFIDKQAGLKVEFKDKVVKLFPKDDLITEHLNHNHIFITISYRDFLCKLETIYKLGKWEEPIEKKLQGLNKKWLNFKIYSYNAETKEEKFLKEIKIENNHSDKGKPRFKINGIKMPIQKMSNALEFIGGCRYGNSERTTIIERLSNLENYLEKIRLFSGKQLDLLEGKTLEIQLNGIRIPIHFNIMAEDKEHWTVSIDDFSVDRNYKDIKDTFRWLRGGGLTAISGICDTLKAGEQLENLLIGRVKGYVKARELAENKADNLLKEFLAKNTSRVFVREGGFVVKGKLKNYIIKAKNDEDVGVWSYPGNEYICINEKNKSGQYLCKSDKLLQFIMVMLNDNLVRDEIHTIR